MSKGRKDLEHSSKGIVATGGLMAVVTVVVASSRLVRVWR